MEDDSVHHQSISKKKVAIIGAGISGLTAAYEFARANSGADRLWDIVIFEASSAVGGVIKTVRENGIVVDLGPECFTSATPTVPQLAQELGIAARIVPQAQRKTFISRDFTLHAIPQGLMSAIPQKVGTLFNSHLLSYAGKLRLAMEPFVLPRRDSIDESLADFIERRCGNEFLDRLLEPFIGGLFGTEPEMLSARSTLPHMVALEQAHGSITLGLLLRCFQHQDNERSATLADRQSLMQSFDGGMGTLIDALSAFLADKCEIRRKEIGSIEPGTCGLPWDLYATDGSRFSFDAVIVATPAVKAATILLNADRELAESLRSIKYSSPMNVSLLYKREDVNHALNGSGFLIPRKERRAIRACTFSSSKFPFRAPEGMVLLRASLDTARMPELSGLSDSDLEAIVAADLADYLQIKKEPVNSVLARHLGALPQLAPGHQEKVVQIEQRVGRLSGLSLIGNGYGGSGVSDCVARARREAKRIVANGA